MVGPRLFDNGRRELLLFAALAVVLVLIRCFVTTWYEGFDFDSDQAVVGLMAKHLSEFRTFPLFFYGQHYMLGVQAWLAAPFFLFGGPSVLMLRAPLVLINGAVVVLLMVLLMRQTRLRPALSFVAALPLIMPTPVTATALLQTLGASVEPFLYVSLLWLLRRRPALFGLVLGVGFLHREFTIFAVPALVAAMALDRSLWTRATLERALTMIVAFIVVWISMDVIKGNLGVFGPASGPLGNGPLTLQMASLTGRICLVPRELIGRFQSLLVECLPALFGTRPFLLNSYKINSTLTAGSSAIGGLLAIAGTVMTIRLAMLVKRDGGTPSTFFCTYLTLIGLQAAAAYSLACEVIPGYPGVVRYVLLVLLVPVALSAAYLKREPVPVLKAFAVAVLIAWAGINLWDHIRTIEEYANRRPPDHKRALADFLVAHDIKYSRADYWDAYIVDFLAREQVVVGSTWKVRILEYERDVDAHRAEAVSIVRGPCAGGGTAFDAWCIDILRGH